MGPALGALASLSQVVRIQQGQNMRIMVVSAGYSIAELLKDIGLEVVATYCSVLPACAAAFCACKSVVVILESMRPGINQDSNCTSIT